MCICMSYAVYIYMRYHIGYKIQKIHAVGRRSWKAPSSSKAEAGRSMLFFLSFLYALGLEDGHVPTFLVCYCRV